jgi:hypothetical protein
MKLSEHYLAKVFARHSTIIIPWGKNFQGQLIKDTKTIKNLILHTIR